MTAYTMNIVFFFSFILPCLTFNGNTLTSNERLALLNKNVESYTGKDLTSGERIGLLLLKKRINKTYKAGDVEKRADNRAGFSFWLAVGSFLFLPFLLIPLVMLYHSALKQEQVLAKRSAETQSC